MLRTPSPLPLEGRPAPAPWSDSSCCDWLKRGRRLAAAVGAIEPFGSDRDDGGDVYDRACAAADKGRCSRVGDTRECKHVQRDHFLHLPDVGGQQRRGRADARVVDQHRDVIAGAKRCLDPCKVLRGGEIGHERLNTAAGRLGEPAGKARGRSALRHQNQIEARQASQSAVEPMPVDALDEGGAWLCVKS
jgi:hypothetical protein